MAKISQSEIWFDGGQFLKIIHCSAKGEFSIALPPRINELTGKAIVTGATKKDVENAFKNELDSFTKLKTKTRKVIIYAINSKAYIMRGEKCILNEDEISFCNGLAVAVSAAMFDEVTIEQAGGKFYYNYNILKSSLPHSISADNRRELSPHSGEKAENAIDWTQQREAFFARLGTAIEEVILELQKLDEPKKVIQIADSGKLKFLT